MRINKRLCGLVIYILLVSVFASMLGIASYNYSNTAGQARGRTVVEEKDLHSKQVGSLRMIALVEDSQEETGETTNNAQKGTYLGTFTVTHYCPYRCCNGKWAGMTASGALPTPWYTIAVDTRKIPMGSKVHIEGYGDFVAQDRGGAIKGNRIDVLVGSHTEALALGVKKMEVYLL